MRFDCGEWKIYDVPVEFLVESMNLEQDEAQKLKFRGTHFFISTESVYPKLTAPFPVIKEGNCKPC